MVKIIDKQFTFNLPSPFPPNLLFEFECIFTCIPGKKVMMQTYDSSLGEATFEYPDCGNDTKNLLYGWHLCAYAALAYALNLV